MKLLHAGLLVSLPAFGAAAPQRTEPVPSELEGVGVEERIGDSLPGGARFTDHTGAAVALDDVFEGDLPVLVTLNYAECPMLCHLQLEGTVDAMRSMPLVLGEDYLALTLSIDPDEAPEQSLANRAAYVRLYGDEVPDDAWRFLTGSEEQIRRVADAFGFGYRWVESTQEYAHAAVGFVCTPDGRIARYLYGVQPAADTLRLSLVEAADGRVGRSLDRFLLFCFTYDPEEGRYALAAVRLMKLGGLTTVVLMAVGLRVLQRTRRAA